MALNRTAFTGRNNERGGERGREKNAKGSGAGDGIDNSGRLLHLCRTIGTPIEEIRDLVRGGISDDARVSALEYAVQSDRFDVVDVLLRSGPAPDEKSLFWVLNTAINNAHADVIGALLDAGAKVSQGHERIAIDCVRKNPRLRGSNALARLAAANDNVFIQLCESGSLVEVQAAIAAGANINAKDENDFRGTALIHAVMYNKPAVAMALLDAGADTRPKEIHGGDAFMYASRHKGSELYKRLERLPNYTDSFRDKE